MTSLAMASNNPHPSSTVLSFFDGTDSFIKQIKVPKISNFSFEVDGIPMNAINHNESGVDKLILWATLGYLPFSITSQEKRRALIQILEGSHILPHVKVGVSADMKIVVTGIYEISIPPTPNYIFEPVIQFIQESRPFIRLIAEYL
ncbi:MAG: hypothetical protein PHD48_02910 [Alphaproteobacteria bacterium]|nr:hypothetical protein [Alphaproteobacteria bacterium]